MSGPPKTPTAIAALRGHPRKQRRNLREPTPQPAPGAASDTPPPDLDAVEAAIWRTVAPELARVGCLTVLDLATLADYCRLRAEGLRRHALAKVSDAPTANLWAGLKCLVAAHALGAKLGLDPSSRTRIAVPPAAEPANRWAGLGLA